MHVKKGDKVIVIAGKGKGASGAVLKSFPKKDLVVVEGVGMVKRHQKARRGGQKSQIFEKPMPIHVSNVKKAS